MYKANIVADKLEFNKKYSKGLMVEKITFSETGWECNKALMNAERIIRRRIGDDVYFLKWSHGTTCQLDIIADHH